MRKILLLIFVASGLFAGIWSEAKVKYVIDGDTLILQNNQKRFKARLIGIDCFETKVNHRVFMQLETLKMLHPKSKNTVKRVLYYGYKAKEYVVKNYLGKVVRYRSFGVDRYNRVLVWVEVLNYSLIRYGLALYYPNNKLERRVRDYALYLSKDANLNHRGFYERY